MKISVIGLGPVGETTARGFSELNYEVIGVDRYKSQVDKINKIGKANLSATMSLENAVLDSDISFVCVGTPCKRNGELDLTYLKKACKQIGGVLKEKLSNSYIVVIRSTMFPGSFEILKEVLEKSSGKKCGRGFEIALNPEFIREKSAMEDFFNPSFIVVGAEKREVSKKILGCYNGIDAKKFLVDVNTAQMIKYANNSFHALKVVFTNELATICKKTNVDSKKLMGLFCEDTRLNISPCYFKPGKAYGGRCLPKEVSVLQDNVKKLKVKCPIINSISESNKEQIKRDRKCL